VAPAIPSTLNQKQTGQPKSTFDGRDMRQVLEAIKNPPAPSLLDLLRHQLPPTPPPPPQGTSGTHTIDTTQSAQAPLLLLTPLVVQKLVHCFNPT
jgi:hypothetical protein